MYNTGVGLLSDSSSLHSHVSLVCLGPSLQGNQVETGAFPSGEDGFVL